MIIQLTQAERDKFATWIEQEAESDRLILGQMDKTTIPEMMKTQWRAKIMAFAIVSRHLRSIEDQEISQ
jgi:hypothetical protein